MESRLAYILRTLREHFPALREKYGVSEMGIFGSVARGDDRPDSDVDILIGFNRRIGLEFVSLADDIEKLIGCEIDLIDNRGLPDRFWMNISKDLIHV